MSGAVLWEGEGSPQDDALMALLGSFSWLAEILDERYAELLDELFDLPGGDAMRIEEKCKDDPVFSAWMKFSAAWKRFKAKWLEVFHLGTVKSGGEFKSSQDMPSALPELREVAACFGHFARVISAAVPALETFEAAQGQVFAGTAWRDDDYAYTAIVAGQGAGDA